MDINKFSGPYRATQLWSEMVQIFRTGIPLKRHRRHIKTYENCFTGSEAVTWLLRTLKRNPNFDPGITKEQTIQLLNKFFKAGIFERATASSLIEGSFKENGDIYQLCSSVSLACGSLLPSLENAEHNSNLDKESKGVKTSLNAVKFNVVKRKGSKLKQEKGASHKLTHCTIKNGNYCRVMPEPIARKEDYNKENSEIIPGNIKDKYFRNYEVNKQASMQHRKNTLDQSKPSHQRLIGPTFQARYSKSDVFPKSGMLNVPLNKPAPPNTLKKHYTHPAVFAFANANKPLHDLSNNYRSFGLPAQHIQNSNYKHETRAYPHEVIGIIPECESEPVYCEMKSNAPDLDYKYNKINVDHTSNIKQEAIYVNMNDILDSPCHRHNDSLKINVRVPAGRQCNEVMAQNAAPSSLLLYTPDMHSPEFPPKPLDVAEHIYESCGKNKQMSMNRKESYGSNSSVFSTKTSCNVISENNKTSISPHIKVELSEFTQSADNIAFQRRYHLLLQKEGPVSKVENENLFNWRHFILTRLQELLPEVDVYRFLKMDGLLEENLLQNGSQESFDNPQFPRDVLSHIKCLLHWPEGFSSDSIMKVKNYLFAVGEPLTLFSLYDIITQAFLYVEYVDTMHKAEEELEDSKILPSPSVENLVLNMASPCAKKYVNKNPRISSDDVNSDLVSTSLVSSLPPNSCFETAFTSDSPITRIVPQRTMESLHFSQNVVTSTSSRTSKCVYSDSPQMRASPCISCNSSRSEEPVPSHLTRNSSAPNLFDPLTACQKTVNLTYSKSMREPNKGQGIKGGKNVDENIKTRRRGHHMWNRCKKLSPEQNGLKHMRSKSGGYVNPALSQSVDDIPDTDIAAVQLDYAVALETLGKLMECSRKTSFSASTFVSESSIDNSSGSESGSYYTAVSSSTESSRCNSQVFTEQPDSISSGIVIWTTAGEQLAITVLQLLLLLIPPHYRARLQLLLCFMRQLASSQIVTQGSSKTWDLTEVVTTFTPAIICSKQQNDYNSALAQRIVCFMVAHLDVLNIPSEVSSQMKDYCCKTNIKVAQDKMTYCEQVSVHQFQQQRLTCSQLALSELLEQILSDTKMKRKERKKRLERFKEAYPHIYSRRFPDVSKEEKPAAEKQKGLFHFVPFSKLKSLRV